MQEGAADDRAGHSSCAVTEKQNIHYIVFLSVIPTCKCAVDICQPSVPLAQRMQVTGNILIQGTVRILVDSFMMGLRASICCG